TSQIPSIALVDVFTVASQAEMLALDAQQGDVAIRSDSGQVYILTQGPATTLGNWIELSALKALVDAAVADLAGTGRTAETVKGNADAITTLNADDATEGSVLKSIKDEAENAKFTPTTESGIESVTIEGAVNEVGVGLDEHKSAIMPHIFQDLSTGKKYRYGFQLSAEGNPQTISEEIL
ncbi:MAG TPA: hypothetical protein VJ869_00885, partial [Sphaerochaeta sp.]|nr:hypothetical protein [Sphaerochaeta sp.]